MGLALADPADPNSGFYLMLGCFVLLTVLQWKRGRPEACLLEESCFKGRTGATEAAQASEAVRSSLCGGPRRWGLTKILALDQLVLRSFTEPSALAYLVW